MQLTSEQTGAGTGLSALAAERASPAWRKVLWLAWPVLIQQLLILAVGLSDRFLAGYFQPVPVEQRREALGHQLTAIGLLTSASPFGGVAPAIAAETPWEAARHIFAQHIAYQSAQTTANYLAWFISCYTVLVSVGSTALVARFVGAKEQQQAVHATNQALVLAFGFGLFAMAAGSLFVHWVVAALQLHGEAAVFAANYLWPIFLLVPFQMIEMAGIACLIGAGDTRMGLWVLGGIALVNLPLAWLFFHGLGPIPALGFEGIALGTALSHVIGGLAVLTVLYRGRAGLRIQRSHMRPDWPLMKRILRISVPAGIDSLSVAFGQFWFLSIVNGLGDVASSAHGIALGWEAMGYLSGSAFGTAAMTLVGQSLGARRPDLAARYGWMAFGLGLAVMCVMAAIFFTFAPQMFALFCPHPEQAPVIEVGVPVLRLVAFAMPAAACTFIFTAALRGAGDTRIPVVFTWIGFFGVRIPLGYALTLPHFDLGALGVWPGADLGLWGAWWAMFADLTVRGLFFLVRFASGRWKTARV